MVEKKMSPVVWIAAGCGLLSVFGCCVGSGVVLFALNTQEPGQMPFDLGGDPGPASFGGGDAPGPAPAPLIIPVASMPAVPTRSIVASVQSASGAAPVSVGSLCYVIIEVRPTEQAEAGYWCKAVTTCNGTVLYGDQATNGFFPCAVYDSPPTVIGEDGETTTSDTDGSIQLDTNARTLILRDDAAGPHGAFRIEAQVTEIH